MRKLPLGASTVAAVFTLQRVALRILYGPLMGPRTSVDAIKKTGKEPYELEPFGWWRTIPFHLILSHPGNGANDFPNCHKNGADLRNELQSRMEGWESG